MEIAEIVDAVRVVEVTAESRDDAIRELAAAVDWGTDPECEQRLVRAVEDREATAQTVLADGLALPHAILEWEGTFRIVLGRSRTGVTYGIPGSAPVHLIVLLLVGNKERSRHLELLAALAELFHDASFRTQLATARDTAGIQRQLADRARATVRIRARRDSAGTSLNTTLVQQAIQLVDAISAQALLLTVDRLVSVPWEILDAWTGNLVIAVDEPSQDTAVSRPQTQLIDVPHKGLSRNDRANLGLLLAVSSGLLDDRGQVVCVTGPGGAPLDSLTVARPESQVRRLFARSSSRRGTANRSAVILRVLALAMELADEGREGRSVGTMFVVGDSRNVLRCAQQMVLNPFHGFSRSLRNVLDPSLAETIKEYAQIDGAFLIQDDGTVLSAGTYLAPRETPNNLPSGWGARHTTAAAITSHTRATAVTVSQSTGTVTVFHQGEPAMVLERAPRSRW
jgi:diadenylate cyclase